MAPKPVGNGVKQISQRRLAQTIGVIGRRFARESTRRNHAIAVTHPRMAGSAINVVALLSSPQQFFGNREGHVISGTVANLSGVEITVFVQLTASHCSLDRRPRRAQVCVKVALGERLEPGLIVHILPATAKHQRGGQQKHKCGRERPRSCRDHHRPRRDSRPRLSSGARLHHVVGRPKRFIPRRFAPHL